MKRIFRHLIIAVTLTACPLFLYSQWTPGQDITDGRHDRKQNGIWMQHGWLGTDRWFIHNRKEDRIRYFRNPKTMKALASVLRQHNITDVYPHLSPTSVDGEIPPVESDQMKVFLHEFDGFRVMPWVGGVVGKQAFPGNPQWRRSFARSIERLLLSHPKLAGIHINIEPCPSGSRDFIHVLDEVRRVLPQGKVLSAAAFPPPTLWHPFRDVHWDEEYYREVSQRADQLVVMMYDTALRFGKIYQYLMRSWAGEILEWSAGADVLFGLPAYDDAGVGYHDPKVENLGNALRGIHASLMTYRSLPENYQGISLYAEWEMGKDEWALLRKRYLGK